MHGSPRFPTRQTIRAFAACTAFSLWVAGANMSAAEARDSTREARLDGAYGKLPLSFEANEGQTDARVRFLSRGRGLSLFLKPREVVLAFSRPAAGEHAGTGLGRMDLRPAQRAVVRMKLEHATSAPTLRGLAATYPSVPRFVRASRAGPLVAGGRRVDPRFLAGRAGDPPLAPRVLMRLAPQPMFTPPWPTTIVPCPLSEPDVRLSRIRLPATIFTPSVPDSG